MRRRDSYIQVPAGLPASRRVSTIRSGSFVAADSRSSAASAESAVPSSLPYIPIRKLYTVIPLYEGVCLLLGGAGIHSISFPSPSLGQ